MASRFRNIKPIFISLSRLSSTRDIRTSPPAITNSLNSQFRCFPPYLPSENPGYNIVPRRWHLGHSHDRHEHQQLQTKEGEKIFLLGLFADIGLATAKAFTGYLSGSTAIIADAAHSVTDVVIWSFFTLITVFHQFGLFDLEKLIILTSVWFSGSEWRCFVVF